MDYKIKNSETYLNTLLEKKTGFSAPKNYFDNIEETLTSTIKVAQFSKENPFSAPNSYFDSLEDSIINKVNINKKRPKVISLKQRVYKALPFGVAASIAILLAFIFMYNPQEEFTIDHLAHNDIENWLIENSATITTQDIATIISIENITDSDFTFASINDTEIEDYIIYNENSNILNEIN